MRKVSVVILIIVGLMFAAYAEAAKPKRRTRNANRIGPYAGVLVGQDTYNGDHGQAEEDLASAFDGVPTQNLRISTKDSGVGYEAAFGYRFARYAAMELGLAQYGELSSTARADVDLGDGFQPASIKLNFQLGGPVISGIGILPFNDKFEMYGRVGVLFAGTEREVVTRVNGEAAGFGNAKGDSTEMVLGLGFAWHINQMYTVRGEFQKLDEVGEVERTGEEDLTCATLGLIVRF
jgi:hypothetical protein